MYMQHILLALATFTAASACAAGLSACNGACYVPSLYHCATDAFTSVSVLCPISSPNSCNGACYNPSQYSCSRGSIVQGAQATPTTKANTPVTSATPSCNCQNCCNGQCYSPAQYSCTIDIFNGKSVLCDMAAPSSCNGACFNPQSFNCQNGALRNGAASATTSKSAATPTTKSAYNTTTAGVIVNPSPVAYPTQTADLRIINNCATTLWFEGRNGAGAPITGQSVTATRALPGSYVDYVIPSTGLSSTRFWAKYGCDSNGKNCIIGDQMQYYPGGGCPTNGCTPPVDSLFEATWGCKPGSSCASSNPTTWFDTSQVDGYTIPYSLKANGATSGCDCTSSGCGFSGVDASKLNLASCPSGEDLSLGGTVPSINVNGATMRTSSVDLRLISNNQVIGCMSPCKKLNFGTPYGLGQSESVNAGLWMCCPTPTPGNCQPSNGCVSSPTCRTGPVTNTQYVKAVHNMAAGVYAYSYDDGVGLHACPAGTVTYTMTYCPSGSSSYPLQL